MTKNAPAKPWQLILLAVITAGMFGTTIYLKDSSRSQRSIIAAARIYADQKMAEIRSRPEFELIHPTGYTSLDGSVLVRGYLRSETDAKALKEIIYTDDLPTMVDWKVEVVGAESFLYLKTQL